MEREWSLFTNMTSNGTTTTTSNRTAGGQNCHSTNPAWDWTTTTPPPPATAAREVHALMLDPRAATLYAGCQYYPDPHLTCLKLGKRQYFGDDGGAAVVEVVEDIPVGKRGGGVTVAVPRCQVEGCSVVLVKAKEYHRRHKVCEMHSKAPKVVVRGAEKRFCQQCSRFHSVSEFDDSKRSCRRRLAGHNERRRKGSHDPISRNSSQGRALSLLSSENRNSWFPSTDLSTRCSAALRELIAENRAYIMASRQVDDMSCNFAAGPSSGSRVNFSHDGQMYNTDQRGWDRYNGGGGGGGGHVTLDLMQAPSSAFGYMSVRERSDEEEEQCSEMWSSFGGTHVM